jgi:hypothetical protein
VLEVEETHEIPYSTHIGEVISRSVHSNNMVSSY